VSEDTERGRKGKGGKIDKPKKTNRRGKKEKVGMSLKKRNKKHNEMPWHGAIRKKEDSASGRTGQCY